MVVVVVVVAHESLTDPENKRLQKTGDERLPRSKKNLALC
jgi:hypothetical protein